jgi:hypothetical protein
MIVIVTHSFVHRVLRGGIVQSAPMHESGVGAGKTYFFYEKEFQQTNGAEMNMTGGDTEEVRHQLERLEQICERMYVLPSSEKVPAAMDIEVK